MNERLQLTSRRGLGAPSLSAVDASHNGRNIAPVAYDGKTLTLNMLSLAFSNLIGTRIGCDSSTLGSYCDCLLSSPLGTSFDHDVVKHAEIHLFFLTFSPLLSDGLHP